MIFLREAIGSDLLFKSHVIIKYRRKKYIYGISADCQSDDVERFCIFHNARFNLIRFKLDSITLSSDVLRVCKALML